MALKTYPARDQQTVFDLAVALYSDARGISDVILLNPTLDLESETYFGQSIVYDDAVRYLPEVFVVDVPEPPRGNWRTRDRQNVYDLAIQVYGQFDDLDKILALTGSLDDPGAGFEFAMEVTDNFLANNLFSKRVVATSGGAGIGSEGGIGVMIIEDTFIVG